MEFTNKRLTGCLQTAEVHLYTFCGKVFERGVGKTFVKKFSPREKCDYITKLKG